MVTMLCGQLHSTWRPEYPPQGNLVGIEAAAVPGWCIERASELEIRAAWSEQGWLTDVGEHCMSLCARYAVLHEVIGSRAVPHHSTICD